jgi:hypothetical protein
LRFYAQTNTIKIEATLEDDKNILKIQQELIFFNKTGEVLNEIYLHNWPNSFKSKNTPLTKRRIEDFNKSLYFAKEEERGFSKILNITSNYNAVSFSSEKHQEDILKIALNTSLKPTDSVIINATYIVKIPNSKFTKYGKKEDGYHLRFWHLTPAVYKNGWQLMSNLNIDDLYMDVANYTIQLKTVTPFAITSNLSVVKTNKNTYNLSGKNKTDIVLSITKKNSFNTYHTEKINVKTDIPIKDLSPKLTTNILNREINFIEGYLGTYPHNEMLLDQVSQKKNPIYGLNQLPSFLSPFSDVFDRDVTLFKAISKKYIDNTLLLNKRSDHWLTDGIQVFLLMEYVKKHYPEVKLLGAFSDNWLLKKFNISKLNFNDKYPFMYQLTTRRFLDQSLTTSLDSLSNFNRRIGNKYKAGLGLQYLKGYLGDGILKSSFQEFYKTHKLKISTSKNFNTILANKTTKDLTWFFGDYVNTNKKIDYTIEKVKTEKDSLKITIKNKRNITAPVALYGVKNKEIKFKAWITGIDSTETVTIAKGDFDKISLNYEQLYPEHNSLNNWKNLNKSILNKPLQMRLIKDISDPYYNQLFYQPVINYNFYDGVSIGVKLHNKPIISRNFVFKVTPTYATKSNTLTGSASALYSQYFEKSIFQNIVYGAAVSHFHYAPELSYSVFTPYISATLRPKSFRDISTRYFTTKYIKVHKESALNTLSREQDRYAVFNLKYEYSNPNIIKETVYKFNADVASNFTKLSADIRFRSLTTNNRQLDVRFFGGVFLKNKTTGNYFSFGLDRPSDYLFEQVYFGRSESSGIFSQQVIISDGGFKSVLPTRFANQYLFSFNSNIGLWKWVTYYNDVAFLKNKGENMYFGYENGIHFNFIPNILELYFPMYSNLGWEVTQEAYPSKIRFVLTLKPRTIYNFFRRGLL